MERCEEIPEKVTDFVQGGRGARERINWSYKWVTGQVHRAKVVLG